MCFSAPVSLGTWLVGMIGCGLLWQRNLRAQALFLVCVVQMQMIEFLLWQNQPRAASGCNRGNQRISRAGLLINHLEPFVLWLAIVFAGGRGCRKLPPLLHVWMLVYGLLSLVYTVYVWRHVTCTVPTAVSAPHLHWQWNYQNHRVAYYTLFLASLTVLSLSGFEDGTVLALCLVVGFLVSDLVYQNQEVVGAMWCFVACACPYILLWADSSSSKQK